MVKPATAVLSVCTCSYKRQKFIFEHGIQPTNETIPSKKTAHTLVRVHIRLT